MSVNLSKSPKPPAEETETGTNTRTRRIVIGIAAAIVLTLATIVVVGTVSANNGTSDTSKNAAAVTYTPVFDCTIDAGKAGETKREVTTLEAAWAITADGGSFCMVDFPEGQNTMTPVQKNAHAVGYPDGGDTTLGDDWDLAKLYENASDNDPTGFPIRLHSIMAPHEADWARGILVLAPNHPHAAAIRAAIAQWDNFDHKLTLEQLVGLMPPVR